MEHATVKRVQPDVEYQDRGEGPPLVFVHGIQGTMKSWDAVAERLLARHRVITFNLRGRGASPVPDDPSAYTLQGFCEDLDSVVARIGEPFVLVGYSMGVSVCLEHLARHGSGRLRGLVLVSGSARLGDEGVWFRHTDLDGIAREAEARAAALGIAEAASPFAVAASWQHVREADLRAILPDVAVPTLVVHGNDDDQCPVAHGRLLAERIPRARLVCWPGAGHNLPGEDAARLAGVFAEFVDALPRRS